MQFQVHLGYKSDNISSYGRDVVIAKSIADKLNVPYLYIEYNNGK